MNANSKHSHNPLSSEFLYQAFALLAAIIVVHTLYLTVIRPNAAAIMEEQLAREAAGQAIVAERSFYTVVKDYEQETCFILLIWSIAIMGFKARRALGERQLLQQTLLQIGEGNRVLPEDARQLSRPLEALPEPQRGLLLTRALLAGLQRFGATRNIQDVSSAINDVCDSESDRLDA